MDNTFKSYSEETPTITQSAAMGVYGGYYTSGVLYGNTLVNEVKGDIKVAVLDEKEGQSMAYDGTVDGVHVEEKFKQFDKDTFTPTVVQSTSMDKFGGEYADSVQDGFYKSGILYGNSLVNMIISPEDKKLVGIGIGSKAIFPCTPLSNAKKYVISFDVSGTLTSSGKINFDFMGWNYGCVKTVRVGRNTFLVHNGIGNGQEDIRFYLNEASGTDGTVYIQNILLFECTGDVDYMNIPYFKGIGSSKMPILSNIGKNVFDNSHIYDDDDVSTSYTLTETGVIVDGLWYVKSPLPKMVNNEREWYSSFNAEVLSGEDYTGRIIIYDETEKRQVADLYSGGRPINFYSTFNENNKNFVYIYASGGIKRVVEYSEIMLSLSNEPYEDYKSSTLSTDEDVILRGIGDVRDELDLTKSEDNYIQRIGEIIIDENDSFSIYNFASYIDGGYNCFSIYNKISDCKSNNIKCDTVSVELGSLYTLNVKPRRAICQYTDNVHKGSIFLSLPIEELGIITSDSDEQRVVKLKAWLSENPITVQYIMKDPITKTIPLSTIPQGFRDGHVLLSSDVEGSLLPTLEYIAPIALNDPKDTITQSTKDSEYTLDSGYLDDVVLYGDTKVNTVINSEREVVIGDDVSGTDITVDGSNEGKVNSAILSGKTLVNVVDYNDVSWTNATVDENRIYDLKWGVNINYTKVIPKYRNKKIVKPNTKYAIIVDILENNTGTVLGVSIINSPFASLLKRDFEDRIGIQMKILTTSADFSSPDIDNLIYFGMWKDGGDLSKHIKFKFMVIEYQEGMENWDIPYFEGMKSVNTPVLTTSGKNLLNPIKVRKGFIFNSDITNGVYPCGEFEVGKDEKYAITIKNNQIYAMYLTHDREPIELVRVSNGSFTSQHNGIVVFRPTAISAYSGNDEFIDTVQVENGTVATPYEPFKSNILSVDEPLELLSEESTLNCITGEVYEPYKKWLIDESITWQTGGWNNQNDTIGFQTTSIKGVGTNVVSTFGAQNSNFTTEDVECVLLNTTGLRFRIKRSKLAGDETPNGFGLWLRSNPQFIIGNVFTPLTKTVNLTNVDQDGNITNNPVATFDNITHISTSSEGLIPTLTLSTKKYHTNVEPNKTYTIMLEHVETSDNELKASIGTSEVTLENGKALITTPSDLTDKTLTLSGDGNKVGKIMVIEGNHLDRDYNYFEGLGSVAHPTIITNQGKVSYIAMDSKDIIDGLSVTDSGIPAYCYEDRCGILDIKTNGHRSVTFPKGLNGYKSLVFCYDEKGNFLGKALPTSWSNRSKIRLLPNTDTYTVVFNTSLSKLGDVEVDNGDISLRSVCGVTDELHLDRKTNNMIIRTDSIILDGNESWVRYTDNTSDEVYSFACNESDYKGLIPEQKVVCDRLSFADKQSGNEGFDANTSFFIYINIANHKLATGTVEEFKTYLSRYPVEVTFISKNPYIATVGIHGSTHCHTDEVITITSDELTPRLSYTAPDKENINK